MNVDWELLRDQKLYVLHMVNDKSRSSQERSVLDGLIHFIDAFQDWTVDQGNATEKDVFG